MILAASPGWAIGAVILLGGLGCLYLAFYPEKEIEWDKAIRGIDKSRVISDMGIWRFNRRFLYGSMAVFLIIGAIWVFGLAIQDEKFRAVHPDAKPTPSHNSRNR